MDRKTINNQINYLETLQKLTESYAEISSGRMKKVRASVLVTRDFLERLSEIFTEVRTSYRNEVAKLAKNKKDKEAITFLGHNGKTVSVFLSANTGLYGDLMQKTFRKFMEEVNSTDNEVTLIGRLGLSLFLSVKPNSPYTYFDYPDYGADKGKMAEIIRHLVQYEAIRVHFGKFRNVVVQEPNVFDINAQTPITNQFDKEGTKQEVKYLFEPTLEQILKFFETEMFSSVFEQAINESQLAKFASRMLAMDRASMNIKVNIKEVMVERLRMTHRLMNRKQLNSLSGIFANGYLK
jgi:F-type H+-transporting ATPase subunit gamma